MRPQQEIHDDSTTWTLVVPHPCSVCGRDFPYRYNGVYRRATLQPIDWICGPCFPTWFQRWESLHDWL